jgi:glyoxalase family protein
MRLEGIHHITAITGDAPQNVEFYAGLMGLRLVKKTVNQDDPTVYHLFYADEAGSPGADLTFFEYPGAARGTAGEGMVHRITWRVGSTAALDFWERRLAEAGVAVEREGDRLRFTDLEGLGLEIAASDSPDAPLLADHPEVPAEMALQGFDGVRAYSSTPDQSREFLTVGLNFEDGGDDFTARGQRRGSTYAFDSPPGRGVPGAGTVHHVAWAAPMEEHAAWRDEVTRAGGMPTPIIDRFYFRSIYFREPSGVLFEIASIGPGFSADEDQAHLGEHLSLPPAYEHLRAQLEPVLTPLPDPRGRAREAAARS